jgi:hypothetical protein
LVEGGGYSGRRQERLRAERIRKFIEDKDRIVAFPEVDQYRPGEPSVKKEKTTKRRPKARKSNE